MLKNALIGVFGFAFLVCAVAFFLPDHFEVRRSITIHAPSGVVFQYVNNLPLNEKWSPWQRNDHSMRVTYGAVREGEGASLSWTSQESGDGRLTVTKAVVPYRIEALIEIPEQGEAKSIWDFRDEGAESVHVTWTITGETGDDPVSRWIGLFMDVMIGDDFEDGLRLLKAATEHQE